MYFNCNKIHPIRRIFNLTETGVYIMSIAKHSKMVKFATIAFAAPIFMLLMAGLVVFAGGIALVSR